MSERKLKQWLAVLAVILLLGCSCERNGKEEQATKATYESGSGDYGAVVFPDLTAR